MPKIVDEQMREATRRRIMRVAASEFARLGFDLALFRAFAHLAEEESDSFNVSMSALYGVNRAFQAEATKLLRDYVAVIALLLEQSLARGEIRTQQVEAAALMVLSLTESYILSARVLGQSEHVIVQQAGQVAELILRGIGTNAP
jgi:hypothetical protein